MFRDRRSLLNIPLVESVLFQVVDRIVERPIDSRWFSRGVIPLATNGFNPFTGQVFCARNSYFTRWYSHANESAIPFNADEWLLYELFFILHDYFHVWSIGELLPHFANPSSPLVELDEETMSDLEFIYIVSEAAATIGVDYWYLARIDVSELCPIDTRFRGLTSPYRERDNHRFRIFNASFEVQSPSFFSWLLDGYCSGVFVGFSIDEMIAEPLLMRWLGHEVRGNVKQRSLIRAWLGYMAGLDVAECEANISPIDLSDVRRRRAAAWIRERLWNISRGRYRTEFATIPNDVRAGAYAVDDRLPVHEHSSIRGKPAHCGQTR